MGQGFDRAEFAFQFLARGNNLSIVVMRPDKSSGTDCGDLLQQFNRLLHVVQHTTGQHQIYGRRVLIQISHEIAQSEFNPVKLENFLDTQTFEKRPGIGFDGGNPFCITVL